jgi:hypothetical protein
MDSLGRRLRHVGNVVSFVGYPGNYWMISLGYGPCTVA